MKAHRTGEGERSLAVFIDFENMGLGFNNRRDRFEITKVLERLVEKGKIVAKKAYADWSRFGMYTGGLHEAAIELVEIPRRGMSGKNSADIRLVVDAIDLAYSKDHIDTFVIVSGDSDFSPLVSKLKELGKHVIGLGLADATSDLLRDNCDEFIYYEDLDRAPIIPVAVNDSIPDKKRKVFAILLDSLLALRRENKEVIYSSMLKDTIKRKKPSFNEGYYGYRTFSELLEDAQRDGLLELEKHKSSGMYVVARFGLELKSGPAPAPLARPPLAPQQAPRNGGDHRRGGDQGPRNGNGNAHGPGHSPGGEVRRVELPPRAAEPRPVELPKPVPPVDRRPPLPVPAHVPPKPLPPADDRADDRPLGRALVDDFDLLDDASDEVPSYAPRRVEPKPAAAPRPAAKAVAKPAEKPVEKPAENDPAQAPAVEAPKRAPRASGKEAPKHAAEAEPAAEPTEAPKPPAKPARGTRGTRAAAPKTAAAPKSAPVEKPEALPHPATDEKPAPVPKAEKVAPRRAEPKPAPPTDDDEFGAGL
jgi:uncharacterized protein (TIGR00288 family)